MDKIKFLLERVRLSFGRNHVISAVPLQKPKIKKKKKKKKQHRNYL
jgi:hypothetical protein